MLFCGEQRTALDDKGRMRIPNKIRAKLDDDYLIHAGTGGCLFIVSQKTFQEKYSAISRTSNYGDEKKQEAFRKLCSTVQIPEEDSQGRFILHPKLKKMAGISKRMVFLTLLERVEIWSEEIYDAKFTTEQIDMADVMKILEG